MKKSLNQCSAAYSRVAEKESSRKLALPYCPLEYAQVRKMARRADHVSHFAGGSLGQLLPLHLHVPFPAVVPAKTRARMPTHVFKLPKAALYLEGIIHHKQSIHELPRRGIFSET